MGFGFPTWGHRRWEQEIAAFADGELTLRDAARFEEHLAVCASCASEVAGHRAVRAALAGLPELRVPRSFVLTPEMAAAHAPVRRAPVWALRTAQAATAVALAGLVTVVGVDLANVGGASQQSATTAAAPLEQVAPASAPSADGAGREPQPTPQPKGIAIPPAGGVGAQSVPSPEATTRSAGSNAAPLAPRDAAGAATSAASDAFSSPAGPPATDARPVTAAKAPDDDGRIGYRAVEAALGGLFIVAGGAVIVLWRRTRRF